MQGMYEVYSASPRVLVVAFGLDYGTIELEREGCRGDSGMYPDWVIGLGLGFRVYIALSLYSARSRTRKAAE